MATGDGVIRQLGRVARERREQADVMIVEVCSRIRQDFGLKKTEGALSRFERGDTTPTYLDAVVEAYARETGGLALEFWADALELARKQAATEPAAGEAKADAGAALEAELGPAARRRASNQAADAPAGRASRRRRAS